MAKNKRASAERVRFWEDSTTIPTSEEGLPDLNPPFDFFDGGRFRNYPYTLRHNLMDRRVRRRWRTLHLENKYLKCCVLPDLGGHIYSCVDKISNLSMFYANPSIKFARVAHRGIWAALGVEFNFPVSHNWMTGSPVDFAMTREADGGGSIWVGSIDRVYGMQWRVQLSLRPGRAYLEQRTTLYNRSDTRHRFYWWTNAAVEVWDDSRILYPMEFTAGHGFADIDSWPVDSTGADRSIVGNHKHGPVSRFSYGSREPYMAVYHPRTRSGVLHYSSPLDLPAKKIWSWGSDEDGLDWRNALSDNDSAYVEIQAGLFRDQETCGFLEPQETRSFTEYWIPIRELDGISRANPEAVLSLNRREANEESTALEITLNVTRNLPKARVFVLDGPRTVASARASLSPQRTFRKVFSGLPTKGTYTFELQDSSGKTLLLHTEGKYDFSGRETIQTGKQPGRTQPAETNMCAEDFLELATHQESNGDLLAAIKTHQRGVVRFANSIALNRATGRLEAILKQYEAAVQHLGKAVDWVSIDHESAYYLGLALAATGDDRQARIHWEFSQQSRTYRAPALLCLAALEARGGNCEKSLEIVQDLVKSGPELVRAGGMEVALLRVLGRHSQAKKALGNCTQRDPTSSHLRYEAVRLGTRDRALLTHLAADPERILEIAVDYLRFGLFEDGLDVLSRQYPSGAQVVGEPGMPHPSSYPLIAYYRGFCRYSLGEDGRDDFDAASRMPIRYVFPNRAESLAVLRRAIDVNPHDASAHFLLGSLYLSGGMCDRALEEWEIARRIRPTIPTLHRNMGYTVLRSGESERAIELFREGIKYDPQNADVLLGLEEAMERAGRSAGDRVRMLESLPKLQSAPDAFVFRFVELLGAGGEFRRAEHALANRFFPREEGGRDVREVYVALKLKHAKSLAAQGQCASALEIVRHLGDPVPNLSFTARGLGRFVASDSSKRAAKEIEAMCRKETGIVAP
jgi:tetratricopeptide (TPR) repeat protein